MTIIDLTLQNYTFICLNHFVARWSLVYKITKLIYYTLLYFCYKTILIGCRLLLHNHNDDKIFYENLIFSIKGNNFFKSTIVNLDPRPICS